MTRILQLLTLILISTLVLLCGQGWAQQCVEGPVEVARMSPYILGASVPVAGCTPTFGAELAGGAIATDDLGGSEADDDNDAGSVGWTNGSLVAYASVQDTDETCGSGASACEAPKAGTYHMFGTVNGSADRMYRDLSVEGLSASTIYKVGFWWRHDGVADGDIGWMVHNNNTLMQIPGYPIDVIEQANTTYEAQSTYFLYNALSSKYVTIGEVDSTNVGGFYVDNFSLKEVTSECFGDELYTTANALNIVSETEATTGFTAVGLTGTGNNVFAVVNEGDLQCGDGNDACPAAHNDSFAITANSNDTPTTSARFYQEIGAAFSLQTGHKYFIRFWIRHVGIGEAWRCFIAGVNNSVTAYKISVDVTSTDITYSEVGQAFTYSVDTSDYFVCWEWGVDGSGGVLIDGMSIKEIEVE